MNRLETTRRNPRKPDRTPRARFAFRMTAAVLLLFPPEAAPAGQPGPPTLTMRVYDERVQRGVDLIYNLRFEEADRYFDDLVASYPDNPLGYFFRAMGALSRLGFVVGGLALLVPAGAFRGALYLDLAGLVLVTGFVGWEYVMTRKERSRSANIA